MKFLFQLLVVYGTSTCKTFHKESSSFCPISKPFTNERFPFSLLEPVSAKTASNGIDDPFLCPTEENPYFATVMNDGDKKAHQMQSLATDYLDTMARMAKTGPIDCSL